jgi:hypothetical protein
MNFKKWINTEFEGDTLKERAEAASAYLCCSIATVYRLYYGTCSGNLEAYKMLARKK